MPAFLGGAIPFTWKAPGGGGGSLLLDSLTVAPFLAVSTRKLRTAYAGSAIRVRRSSDSTEQDIGFASGELDTSALATFVGSGSGYVSKWYNQATGGAPDLAQATAADQAAIVLSGTTQLFHSGKPAPLFPGSGHNGIGASVTLSATSSCGVSGVFALMNGGQGVSGARIVSYNGTGSGGDYANGSFTFVTDGNAGNDNTNFVMNSGTANVYETIGYRQFAISSTGPTNVPTIAFDGGGGVGTGVAASSLAGTGVFRLGSDGSGTSLNGTIGEVIFQTTNNSSDLAAIAANQKTYWGTP